MRKIKKIVFLGNFSIDFCTEVHHAATYERLGIEVVRLQEGQATGADVIQAIANGGVDAFCWTHSHGRNTEGIEQALLLCKEKGIPTYGYHLDLWLGIERVADLETDPFWKIQYFFSVDPEMVDLLNSRDDMPKAFFLPAGVFEDECYLAEPNREKYPHDIIFVGSYGYHPEWPYRPKLIDWLKQTYGDKFGHYGGDGIQHIRGHELNVLYASAKIVVGDTLCPGFNKPGYLSDRIFETTGRGGMIIHPYIEGINGLFVNFGERVMSGSSAVKGLEIGTYYYNDFGNLKNTIDFFLREDTGRELVRKLGHERTIRDHTYTQRLKSLINTLENE